MKILAVDDDRVQLDLLAAILAHGGYSDVTAATSGGSALHQILNSSIDFECVLLDVQMPELDGIELCEIIRQIPNYQDVPIVMITAMSDKAYIESAFVAGATDYVTKPFDSLELLTRIKLAANMNDSGKDIAKKVFSIKELQSKIEASSRFAYDEPIEIKGISCVVDRLRLQNYLLQISRIEFLRYSAVALKISEFRELYEHLSATDLHDILTDIAEVISEQMRSGSFLMAYQGSGIFVCVVDHSDIEISENLRQAIQVSLDDFGLMHDDGRAWNITIHLGEPQRGGVMSIGGPLQVLEDAISSVEHLSLVNARGMTYAKHWLNLRSVAAKLGIRSKLQL